MNRLWLPLCALALAACNFDTTYHLVSPGDPLKYSLTKPALEWSGIPFDDASWRLQGGAMNGAGCWTRSRFDLGPQAAAFRSLSLLLPVDGSYTAYINGLPLLETSAAGPSPMAMPSGLLQPTDNVLALEYHPGGAAPFQILPTLDGKPEPGSADGPLISRGPYLLQARADGITIAWDTDPPAQSQAIVDGKVYDGGAGRHHRVRIEGLAASTAYPYQVEVGNVKSAKLSLTTAPNAGERVRFVVYGDTRTNGDVHRQIAQQIAGEAPDFVLNTGDLVGQSTQSEFDTFFALEYPLLSSTPLMATIGNHETDYGDSRDEFAELFAPADAQFLRRVYSTDYGDVHVAMLNSSGTLAEQVDWLDADLAAARARGAKHLFIALHHGPYSSGSTINHGSNGAAQSNIMPMALKYGVTAIFSGHDHFYERGAGQGITYVVTGGGGAPLTGAGNIAETRASRSVNHYVLVDVLGGKMHLAAKDLIGTVFDELDVQRP